MLGGNKSSAAGYGICGTEVRLRNADQAYDEGPNDVPTTVSPVAGAGARISRVTDDIEEVIRSLYQKLDSALSPDGQKSATKNESPVPIAGALTVSLHEHAVRLHYIKNSLEQLIERIDI